MSMSHCCSHWIYLLPLKSKPHILLKHLEAEEEISGCVSDWFKSFLTDWTEWVVISNCSLVWDLSCQVPQKAAVLSPMLFNLYVKP